MLYAQAIDGQMIEAIRDNPSKGICPSCREGLIKKCGDIKVWHWAHKSGNDCDTFGEPETEWHLEFKRWFKDIGWKVEFPVDGHRADIKHPMQNLIIEVQHSPISWADITHRTNFYRYHGFSIMWIFNTENWKLDLRDRISQNTGNPYISFRWKYPHKSLESLFNETNGKPTCNAVFFDSNNDLDILKVEACHMDSEYVGGWGKNINIERFFTNFNPKIENPKTLKNGWRSDGTKT